MKTVYKAIKGAFWNNFASYYVTLVKFFGGVYLARKIAPNSFGEWGLATSVVAIFWAGIMIGQPFSLFRSTDKEARKRFSVHLTIRILLIGLVGMIVGIFFLTPFLQDSEIPVLVVFLFLSQIPAEIVAIYGVYMQRKMLFGRLAIISVFSSTSAVLLACFLAWRGWTIWALMWLFMGEKVSRAFLTFVLSPKRFEPAWDKKIFCEFLGFGKNVFAVNLIRRLYSKIDDLSIGKFVNKTSLGFYQRAYGLTGLMQRLVAGGVISVSRPIFGRVCQDKRKLGRKFELVSKLLLRLAIGGYVWMAIVLPNLIVLIYGERWLPTVPIFRLMLPYALIQSFNTLLKNTHFLAGDSSRVAKIKGIELGTLLVFLYPLLTWRGAAGVAVAVDISAVAGTILLLYHLRSIAEFNVLQLFFPPLLTSVFGFLGYRFIRGCFHIESRVLRLSVDSLSFLLPFLGTLLCLEFRFWKKVFLRTKAAFLGH